MGGFYDIFRDLLWGLKKKYRISLFKRAISWDPLENRPGANREHRAKMISSKFNLISMKNILNFACFCKRILNTGGGARPLSHQAVVTRASAPGHRHQVIVISVEITMYVFVSLSSFNLWREIWILISKFVFSYVFGNLLYDLLISV